MKMIDLPRSASPLGERKGLFKICQGSLRMRVRRSLLVDSQEKFTRLNCWRHKLVARGAKFSPYPWQDISQLVGIFLEYPPRLVQDLWVNCLCDQQHYPELRSKRTELGSLIIHRTTPKVPISDSKLDVHQPNVGKKVLYMTHFVFTLL